MRTHVVMIQRINCKLSSYIFFACCVYETWALRGGGALLAGGGLELGGIS
jgi:hypothetical protein